MCPSLMTPRVAKSVSADPASGSDQGAQPTFGVLREGDFNLPGEPDLAVDADQLLVLIPDSIQALRDTSLEGIM